MSSVEEQLAITLCHFGHDGNAASLQSIANWTAVWKGTVLLVTQQVMMAILRAEFMDEVVHFPTDEKKEAAKRWVHKCSCRAWCNGWCFVDGTLVSLAEWPYWFGESHFALNIQAHLLTISTPCYSNLTWRLSHSLIYESLILLMAILEAPMTQQPGLKHVWWMIMRILWNMVNGFRQIQLIQ